MGDVFHQQKFQVVCFFGIGFRGRVLAMEKERNDLRDAQAQCTDCQFEISHSKIVSHTSTAGSLGAIFLYHCHCHGLCGPPSGPFSSWQLQSGTRTPRLHWALGPYRESRPWHLLRQSSKVSWRQVHSTSPHSDVSSRSRCWIQRFSAR